MVNNELINTRFGRPTGLGFNSQRQSISGIVFMFIARDTEGFIYKAKLKHGSRFDYSLVNFINSKTKINIICSIHGVFAMSPNNHLNGQICPKCRRKELTINETFTRDEFIKRAVAVHGSRYDYSHVDYKTAKVKINIVCNRHGVFSQKPDNHLHGQGCPKCRNESNSIRQRLPLDEFIKRAIGIHGDRYDYSMVDYNNLYDKVLIICPRHGVFKQTALNHLQLEGCKKCKRSRGQERISRLLEKYKTEFIEEKTFPECKDQCVLRFDFFLPSCNAIIEFHGKQHFYPYDIFGGLPAFLKLVQHDEYKKRWALENGYVFKEYTYKDSWDYIESDIKKIITTTDFSIHTKILREFVG